MSYRSVFITTATLGSLAAFAGQDPRIDYSFAAPSLDGTDAGFYVQQPVPVQPSKNVSVTFRNAEFKDVMNWLQKQGVSFVVEESTIKGKRVSINIVDQPLPVVLDAIASSLGGHWVRRGAVHTFRTGPASFFEAAPRMPLTPEDSRSRVFVQPPIKPGDATRMYRYQVPLDPEMADRISKEIEKAMKDAKLDDPEFWKKFNEELRKNLQKHAKPGSPGTIPPQVRVESKILKTPNTPSVSLNSDNFLKFRESLTAAQRDLHKKQGHLKVSDLTQEQRKLLGISEGAIVSLQFSRDGETIKIQK